MRGGAWASVGAPWWAAWHLPPPARAPLLTELRVYVYAGLTRPLLILSPESLVVKRVIDNVNVLVSVSKVAAQLREGVVPVVRGES